MTLDWNEFPLCLFRTWKLQTITILYIGGASSTSYLLTCRELDGNQDASATFRCKLICFFRFWVLMFMIFWRLTFGFRLSCFLFVSFAPDVFVFRCLVFFMRVFPKSAWRLTLYKVQKQPAPIRCVFWKCGSFWMYLLYIISCRFESHFWMPRCYPKFPISGTPSSQLHLQISNACYPVYGAHED